MTEQMRSSATTFGLPIRWIGMLGLAVFLVVGFAPAAFAGSVNGSASVIIQEEGSVGESTPTETTTTTTPTPDTSTVDGGGAASPEAAVTQAGVTTFRPVPGAVPVSPEATTDTDTATSTGGDSTGNAATAQQGPRLPRGAQPVGNLLGGVSAVAVTGTPNQHYGISLPGATVITQGAQTTVIEGFVHNAGETPTLGSSGRGSFNVGAKVAPGAESGSGTVGGAAANQGNPNYQGPVIISDPFMDVIIQYN